MKFSINQDVGCLMYGIGKVIVVNQEQSFIRVEFKPGKTVCYKLDGSYSGDYGASITLFNINKYHKIREFIDNPEPIEAGDYCYFYDHTGRTVLDKFSGRTELHSPLKCYYTEKGDYYPYMVKFKGELPEHLTKPLPDPFLHKKSK